MNNAIKILATILLCIVVVSLRYFYLNYRNKEEKNLRLFFIPEYNKNNFIISLCLLCVSVLILLYSYIIKDKSLMQSFINAVMTVWVVTLGLIDLKEKIIPNCLVVFGIGFWLITSSLEVIFTDVTIQQVLTFSLIGAGVCGGVLFAIALIVKSALGMGDVKMFFVIGLLYGLTNTYSILLFSILVMAVISIILLIAKKVTRKTAIPMAPFVAFGFLLNVLIGM